MIYLCMEEDLDTFGSDRWQAIACRYAGKPAKVTPGLTRAMSVLELSSHHWNLRLGAHKSLRNAAIKAYHPFLQEMRDANPGIDIMQWAFPCFWSHHWPILTEAQREQWIDHWVGVMKELGLSVACPNYYDAVPVATAGLGDPNAAYELAIGQGKCMLARAVADRLGGPCFVATWPRQRGIGAASAIGGRVLACSEILPMANTMVKCGVDGAIVWHGDNSHCGTIGNENEAKKYAPEIIAATREQWAPQVFGPNEEPVWNLSTLPRVLHAARRERLRFADTLVAATSN